MELLSEKEKEEISKLRYGFNVVPEDTEYTMMNGLRIEISKYWARKLLKFSLYLNIVAIVCYSFTFVVTLLKPEPHFFASKPNGEIFQLKTVKINENK